MAKWYCFPSLPLNVSASICFVLKPIWWLPRVLSIEMDLNSNPWLYQTFFLEYLSCTLKATKAFDAHSMYNSSNKNGVGKEQVLKKFAGSGEAWSPESLSTLQLPISTRAGPGAWVSSPREGVQARGMQRSLTPLDPIGWSLCLRVKPLLPFLGRFLCFRVQTLQTGWGKGVCACYAKWNVGCFKENLSSVSFFPPLFFFLSFYS